MGHRTAQRILTCSICNNTPEDGEYLWEMCGEYWCEPCTDDQYNNDEDEGGGSK